jgi:hypothetical protein
LQMPQSASGKHLGQRQSAWSPHLHGHTVEIEQNVLKMNRLSVN